MYVPKEMNASEALKTCRELKRGVKTELVCRAWKSWRVTLRLLQWHPADRRHDLGTGVVCERGNRKPDVKRKATSERTSRG